MIIKEKPVVELYYNNYLIQVFKHKWNKFTTGYRYIVFNPNNILIFNIRNNQNKRIVSSKQAIFLAKKNIDKK